MDHFVDRHVGGVSDEHRPGGGGLSNVALAVVGLSACGVVAVAYVLVIAHVLFGGGGVATWP